MCLKEHLRILAHLVRQPHIPLAKAFEPITTRLNRSLQIV